MDMIHMQGMFFFFRFKDFLFEIQILNPELNILTVPRGPS